MLNEQQYFPSEFVGFKALQKERNVFMFMQSSMWEIHFQFLACFTFTDCFILLFSCGINCESFKVPIGKFIVNATTAMDVLCLCQIVGTK